jgi:hypothetical protein
MIPHQYLAHCAEDKAEPPPLLPDFLRGCALLFLDAFLDSEDLTRLLFLDELLFFLSICLLNYTFTINKYWPLLKS